MASRHVFDTSDPEVNAYRLLTSLVVPRPIAWVSTVAADGTANLAPHSFFTVASADPPVVQFTSVGAKDTLRNVQETGEFVVSLASLRQIDLVNASSAPFPASVDEAQTLGIATEPSDRVRPPRVRDAPASLECALHSTLEIGDCTLIFGRVVSVSVRDEVMVEGRPAFDRLAPVSRLGGSQWGLPPRAVSLKRPTDPPPGV